MYQRRVVPVAFVIFVLGSLGYAETVRFAVLGDTRGSGEGDAVNESVFGDIIDDVLAADPPVQFVVILGDLVNGTGNAITMGQQFQVFRQVAAPWYESDMIGAKLYAVPGNHDLRNVFTYDTIWQTAFPELPDNGPEDEKKLVYSFDAGPVHLVVVNTSSPINNHRVDLDWLDADLAASDAPIKMVFGHDPAYPCDGHIGSSLDTYPVLRDAFWQMLVDYDVSVYFCAHEHLYDHWIKDSVHQIISGGGGAPGWFFHYLIVDADEEDATITVYKHNGQLYETYCLCETDNVASEERIASEPTIFDLLHCSLIFAVVLACGVTGFSLLTPVKGPEHG